MTPLRILLIAPTFPPQITTCGVGDYSAQVAQQLQKHEAHLSIALSAHYTGPKREESQTFFTIKGAWGVCAAVSIFKIVVAQNIDVVNLQYADRLYRFSFKILMCLLGLMRPVVVSFHNLHGGTIKSRAAGMLLLLFCKGAILTNEELQQMVRKVASRKKSVYMIPIGLNVAPLKQPVDRSMVRTRLGIAEDEFVITNFGLFYPGRGCETLLKACAQFKNRLSRYRLLLLGALRDEDADYINLVRSLIQHYQLEDHVCMPGRMEERELAEAIAVTDLYVIPYDRGASFRRATTITPVVYGLAAITTTPPIPSPLLFHDSSIMIVPPKNSTALADTMVALYQNPVKRRLLAQTIIQGREYFNWDSIGERLYRVLLEVAGKKP